jgi:hypothetical protein
MMQEINMSDILLDRVIHVRCRIFSYRLHRRKIHSTSSLERTSNSAAYESEPPLAINRRPSLMPLESIEV